MLVVTVFETPRMRNLVADDFEAVLNPTSAFFGIDLDFMRVGGRIQ